MNKKLIVMVIFGMFLISFASAVDTAYCCERLKDDGGAWCQNAPQSECEIGNKCNGEECKMVPTSCESTSFCKLGCCYDSQEGTCMENVPQSKCNSGDYQGVWEESAQCEIPQCELGCCLLGDQAAFVTQTRCNRLASVYGLEINFRTDINNEVLCIASATPEADGGCVFEDEIKKTCKRTTKRECNEMEGGVFHEGYLCSAYELGVDCGPTTQTTCVEGKEDVYFLDSCGNLANIYDESKVGDDGETFDNEYWTYIANSRQGIEKGVEVCDGNPKDCGNCDYSLGSTCRTYKRDGKMQNPEWGDYVCERLDCENEDFRKKNNRDPKHGESWCVGEGTSEINVGQNGEIDRDDFIEQVSTKEQNLPGSRYFRLVCYAGEVTVEPCADFRQEICIQGSIEDPRGSSYKTAACRVNLWQDCVAQDEKNDCKNLDKRDCYWNDDRCVPLFAPGFNFWEEETEAVSLCSAGNSACTIVKKERLLDLGFLGLPKEETERGSSCKSEDWEKHRNKNRCIPLGDCGYQVNFVGEQGGKVIEDVTEVKGK
ncbi:hypothetical protein ACFL0X_00700 [Nanoarchaeota archaeon]